MASSTITESFTTFDKLAMEMFKRIKDLVEGSTTILLTTHIYPDADGLGSQIAMDMALKQLKKKVYSVNQEPIQERYSYLDAGSVIKSYKEFTQEVSDISIDLMIIIDTNSTGRVGHDVQKLVEKSKRILFLDHHPCSKAIQALHCIDVKAAATGEIVGSFLKYMNIKINEQMALALYTAILIDTNSFRYPTVTGETHQVIAQLIDTGLRPDQAYNQIYGTKQISHLQLLGMTLSKAQISSCGHIAWITLDEQDLKKFNADIEDIHSFVNHLLVLDKVKIACMFRNYGKNVKVSFRSTEDLDVGAIAQALGGGGHMHSSATVLEGNLQETVSEVISKLEIMVKNILE